MLLVQVVVDIKGEDEAVVRCVFGLVEDRSGGLWKFRLCGYNVRVLIFRIAPKVKEFL